MEKEYGQMSHKIEMFPPIPEAFPEQDIEPFPERVVVRSTHPPVTDGDGEPKSLDRSGGNGNGS